MVSDPDPAGPQFRTTYLKGKNGAIITRFELAPPDDPDGLKLYIEGSSIRI